MKKRAIVPFRCPIDLKDVDKAEQIINKAFKDRPPTNLYFQTPVLIDTSRLYKGRKVMREVKSVQIEEIGRDL